MVIEKAKDYPEPLYEKKESQLLGWQLRSFYQYSLASSIVQCSPSSIT